MKYCKFCGNEYNDNEKCTCAEAQNDAKKKEKIYWIAGIAAFLLIVGLISIISTSSGKNPLDYTTVTFSGYNSNGVANIRFNEDELIESIIGEEPEFENFEKYAKWDNQYTLYSDSITYSCEPSEGLSNGDEVVLTFSVDDAVSGKVKEKKKTYTVQGLTEVETIDVFASIKVVFDGVSGDGQPRIEKNDESEFLNACSFSFGQEFNLSNGDKVIVSISNVNELAEKYHCIPKETKKEIQVSGLGSYATSLDQIPEKTIQEIADQFVSNKNKSLEDDFIFSYGDAKYYNAYFMVKKDEAMFASENELHIFVCYDEYVRGTFNKTVYLPLVFKNVIVGSDNSVKLNYEDGNSDVFTTDMDDHLEKLSGKYEIFTLK